MTIWLALAGLVAALSYWITKLVRDHALKAQWLDHPNLRSSHVRPTPRGGGISIVATSLIGFAGLAVAGWIDWRLVAALVGGGLAVALIGFLDDRRSTSVRVRMLVHAGAAVWSVYCLGGLAPMRVGDNIYDLGLVGDALATLSIMWVLNLFNFMDGIDGIAASQAVFMAVAGALLAWFGDASVAMTAGTLILAGASLGFLLWNWPPAKIFMGDVGSGYLGFVIAVLAIAAQKANSVAGFAWLILGGVFFCDSTATLVRRLLRNQKAYEAHRSHAYQWLARRWGGHRRVTLTVLGINLGWLLPCAFISYRWPNTAAWMTLVALGPVLTAVLLAGAGRPETPGA